MPKLCLYLVLMIALLLAISVTIYAQDTNNNVSLVSSSLKVWDAPSDFVISGNYAYLTTRHTGLRILDISNSASPQEVGYYDTPDIALGLAVRENIVYVADYEAGIRVIDVSDPVNPEEINHFDIPGEVYHITIQGDYAYVSSMNTMFILNVSDPMNIVQCASCNHPFKNIIVQNNYAYLVNGSLHIMDITNPYNPLELGSCNLVDAIDIAIKDNFVYAAISNFGFKKINISNPAAPFLTDSFEMTGNPKSIAIANDFIYMGDGYGGLQVISIQNSSPMLINTLEYIDALDLMIQNSTAYLLDWMSGFRVIDIIDPYTAHEIGYVNFTGAVLDVKVVNNFAYVAKDDNGLYIFDVSNPVLPQEIGHFNVNGSIFGLDISGNYVYLADNSGYFRIVDISNPANPQEIGACDSLLEALKVKVTGDYAYVVNEYYLNIINISDQTNPHIVYTKLLPGHSLDVCVLNNYAYMALGEAGFGIYDISGANQITEIGFFVPQSPWPDNFNIESVYISGNYAYLAESFFGLYIIDISDPTTPTEVCFFPYDWIKDVVIQNNVAFIISQISGLQILDVSNPSNPILLGNYDTPGFAEGIDVSGNFIFVADHYHFGIYDCSAAPVIDQTNETLRPLSLKQNSPNPFNPSTTISFHLDKKSKVRIDIFNIKGQLVRTLLNENLQDGDHSVFFNGTDDSGKALSSGVYFYRADSTNESITKKMLLLK